MELAKNLSSYYGWWLFPKVPQSTIPYKYGKSDFLKDLFRE